MPSKTYITDIERVPDSQIGATLDALFATIEARRDSPVAESYTKTLLDGPLDKLLKKVSEEALESCLAAKECQMLEQGSAGAGVGCGCDEDAGACCDESSSASSDVARLLDASIDHLRYESADVIYHLLVLLARFGVDANELAAELNYRMREDERPEGCVLLRDEHVKRGK